MDASSCSIYTQLLGFQNDLSQHQLIFDDPNSSNQAYIQTLTRGLGLEFEYSSITNSARITRRSSVQPQPVHPVLEEDFLRFLDLEQSSAGQPSGELPDTYEVPVSTHVGRENGFRIQDEVGTLLPRNYDSTFSFELASPELDHPSHSVDENSHLNNFGLHLNNAGRLGFTPEEQFSTSMLTSNVPISQPPIDTTIITQEPGPSVSKTDISERKSVGSPSEAEMSLHIVERIAREVKAQLLQEVQQQQQAPSGNNGSLETSFFSPHENEQVETQLSGRDAMEKSTFRSRRNGSRAGSTSSRTSDNGRNRITKAFSRRGSIQEGAYQGYQVYDSKSTHSAASSIGSVASTGRRGPLSGAARALANAVKAVKACWRCKFLRKGCDVELPCASCPKGLKGQDNSAWVSLGCRRGELKDEMPDIKLCPCYRDPCALFQHPIPVSGSEEESWIHANECSQRAIARRQEALADILANDLFLLPGEVDEFKTFLKSLQLFPSECRGPSNIDNTFRTALVPLHECIYSIVWEVTDCPKLQSIFGKKHPMLQEFVILRSAANYQATHETDKLIALSLICLRTCLEAVRIMHECIDRAVHGACGWIECKVESITNLETHLNMYLSELSQVFFKKDNLRSKSWWLSAFYSFFIQSIVRRGLIELTYVRHQFRREIWECLPARKYLGLALRLFVATSSTYDPLMRDYSPKTLGCFVSSRTDDEESLDHEFMIAQEAAQQDSWETIGISGSLQYLQHLFEDSEEDMQMLKLYSDRSGLNDSLLNQTFDLATDPGNLMSQYLFEDSGVMQMYRDDTNRSQLNDPVLDLTFNPATSPGKQICQSPNYGRVFCQQCDSIPEGFESEKELRMHQDREHRVVAKKWICIESTDSGDHPKPVLPLSRCKACTQQKQYGAYYNAAAHLRRAHFKPKAKGRNKTVDKENNQDERRRGDWPSLVELKYWMKEIEEPVIDYSYHTSFERIESPFESALEFSNDEFIEQFILPSLATTQ